MSKELEQEVIRIPLVENYKGYQIVQKDLQFMIIGVSLQFGSLGSCKQYIDSITKDLTIGKLF